VRTGCGDLSEEDSNSVLTKTGERASMPYEVLEQKIKALPETAFIEVSHYVDYIYSKYVDDKTDEQAEKVNALNSIFGILSDDEAEEMREHCHLNFREVNP
jgi:hypothetical protein